VAAPQPLAEKEWSSEGKLAKGEEGEETMGEGGAEAQEDDAATVESGAKGSDKPDKKRGRNKKRPRDTRIDWGDQFCRNLVTKGVCTWGDKCKYTHDVAEFLKRKEKVSTTPCLMGQDIKHPLLYKRHASPAPRFSITAQALTISSLSSRTSARSVPFTPRSASAPRASPAAGRVRTSTAKARR
jgi:hypothetical protein